MTNQNPSFDRKTSDKNAQSNQVKDTDAALTDKGAASTLNPNPNVAKPDPTMDNKDWNSDAVNKSLTSEEGWNSDATGSTVGTEDVANSETGRRNWQSQQSGQNRQSNQNWQSDQNRQSNQNWQGNNMTEQTKQAANDAKQGAKDLAGQAKQAAVETVNQAKQAVSDTLDGTREQVQSAFDQQKSQAANRLGGLATALRQTGDNLQNQNEDTFAHYAQAAAEQIDQFSKTLENKNMTELWSEVQSFASRQPEVFIAGSLAAGFLLGRFLKSSGARSSSGNYRPSNYGNQSNSGRSYGQGYYGSRNVGKNSTTDAITRMDYESPSTPQNIEISRTEGKNAW